MRRATFIGGAAGVVATAPALAAGDNAVLRIDASPLGHDIDPYVDPEIGVDELAWLYADGLLGWDGGRAVPLLAELPTQHDAGRRYRYRLRESSWHDGTPLSTRDVDSALAAIRGTPFGSREPYRSVRRLIAYDERHFDVLLESARPGFAQSFFGAYGTPALPLVRRAPNGLPIGTGPFEVRARPEPLRWRLERYAASHRGVPLVDRLNLRLLPSQMTASVQLLSGEADLALPLTPAAVRSGRLHMVERTTSTAVLVLNAEGAFRRPETRRIFAETIDIAALQRRYDRRRTSLLASLLLRGDNDPTFAALLSARRPPADLRTALGDHELSIAYVRESASLERTALLLKQMLDEAGIRSLLRPAPAIIYQSVEGPLRTGRFDIAFTGVIYGDPPDLAADWSCGAAPPHGGNFSRWCDALFDRAAARGDVNAMLRRLYDTAACIPLSRAYEELGVGERVRGFTAPDALTPATYGCCGWSIAPSTNSRSPSSGRPCSFRIAEA